MPCRSITEFDFDNYRLNPAFSFRVFFSGRNPKDHGLVRGAEVLADGHLARRITAIRLNADVKNIHWVMEVDQIFYMPKEEDMVADEVPRKKVTSRIVLESITVYEGRIDAFAASEGFTQEIIDLPSEAQNA